MTKTLIEASKKQTLESVWYAAAQIRLTDMNRLPQRSRRSKASGTLDWHPVVALEAAASKKQTLESVWYD